MSRPNSAPGPPAAVWSAAAVARRLGVAPGTLRSWSQRYGIGPAAHSPGRHRRYTAADVAELDAIRELVEQGMVLSAAAAIVRSLRGEEATDAQPRRPAPPPAPAREPAALVHDLTAAAARLDPSTATAIVEGNLARRGVIATWEQVCRPALDRLDAEVDRDPGCADAQLLLSAVLTTCLRALLPAPHDPSRRPVLLACAAGEQHTLGLDALYAALAEHHVPARMLGAAVPVAALLHAARRLRPTAAVVWSQRAATAKASVLQRLTAHTDAVLAAGPGWRQVSISTRATRVGSLPAAVALLAPTPVGQPNAEGGREADGGA